MQNVPVGDDIVARALTPEIMADSAYAIIAHLPTKRSGIDEGLLAGVDQSQDGLANATADLFVD